LKVCFFLKVLAKTFREFKILKVCFFLKVLAKTFREFEILQKFCKFDYKYNQIKTNEVYFNTWYIFGFCPIDMSSNTK